MTFTNTSCHMWSELCLSVRRRHEHLREHAAGSDGVENATPLSVLGSLLIPTAVSCRRHEHQLARWRCWHGKTCTAGVIVTVISACRQHEHQRPGAAGNVGAEGAAAALPWPGGFHSCCLLTLLSRPGLLQHLSVAAAVTVQRNAPLSPELLSF